MCKFKDTNLGIKKLDLAQTLNRLRHYTIKSLITNNKPTLMPRYLHIPHTPDTARKMMTGDRKYLTVSGITTTPPTRLKRYTYGAMGAG